MSLMIVSGSVKKQTINGLEIIAKCPRCKTPMYKKPECPCFLKSRGYVVCAKCIHCGHQIGIKKGRAR